LLDETLLKLHSLGYTCEAFSIRFIDLGTLKFLGAFVLRSQDLD